MIQRFFHALEFIHPLLGFLMAMSGIIIEALQISENVHLLMMGIKQQLKALSMILMMISMDLML
jgi:hypothetical protein